MKTPLQSDAEITNEALRVLMRHMPASKVARFLSSMHIGTGDYLKIRDELFAGETVETLFQQALNQPPKPS